MQVVSFPCFGPRGNMHGVEELQAFDAEDAQHYHCAALECHEHATGHTSAAVFYTLLQTARISWHLIAT